MTRLLLIAAAGICGYLAGRAVRDWLDHLHLIGCVEEEDR